jgi:hypothetical protein
MPLGRQAGLLPPIASFAPNCWYEVRVSGSADATPPCLRTVGQGRRRHALGALFAGESTGDGMHRERGIVLHPDKVRAVIVLAGID